MRVAYVAALCATLLVAGCNSEYGYSRSAFGSKFVDKVEQAAIDSAGQPARVEQPDPDTHVLIYERKTFDQENGNSKDALVRVTFRKNPAGQFAYAGIDFQAQ